MGLSGWGRLGVVISVLWIIAFPSYLTVDTNNQANEFYQWCRKQERPPSTTIVRLSYWTKPQPWKIPPMRSAGNHPVT